MSEISLSFIKKHWKDILVFVLFAVVIVLIMNTTCISRDNNNMKNNIKALTDSVQVLETKNGELLYSKQSLILEKNELEKYIGISDKKIKDLEKTLNSKIAYITKLESKIKIDTIYLKDTVKIIEDTTYIYFNDKNRWYSIDGETKYFDCKANTKINSLEMNVPILLTVTKDCKVGAMSENPYVKFDEINSAILEDAILKERTRKKWGVTIGVGPYVGYGVSFGGTKGLSEGFEVGVGFSIMVGYHLVSL